MPVKKKKKFICKKDATNFQLIPGCVEDEDVTQMDEIPKELEARKELQRQYGIFFDDKYNYMKHLKSVEEKAILVKVESFQQDDETCSQYSRATVPFPLKKYFSKDETKEEKIDPEILAALDDAPELKVQDEDDLLGKDAGDDFLDDDFIAAAGGAIPKVVGDSDDEDGDVSDRDHDFDEEEEEEESDDGFDNNRDGDFGSDLEDRVGGDLEVHQGRGNLQDDIVEAQTALILKNFEEGLGFRTSVQPDEYDEEALPTQEDYENLMRIIKYDKFSSEQNAKLSEVLDDKTDRPKIDSSKYIYDDVIEFEWKDAPPSKPKFDCVSILSLNSNTRNLPTDIVPPRKEPKPKKGPSLSETSESVINVRPGLTLQKLEAEMRESRKADRASTFRPQDETADEKKARKKAIKDERKERRQEKKANKEVFTQEREKMKKETAALSKSVKGMTIC